VQSIPENPKASDYLNQIQRFPFGTLAHWTSFPVRVHLPQGSPENWKAALDAAVKKWGQYIPVLTQQPAEPADIEVAWINHLQPRQLGITNLEIFNGHMRVTVYLLRPNYYPPDVHEKVLQSIAMHEIGHALGLFGHSPVQGDIMFAYDGSKGPLKTNYGGISQRDLNTLRKVYESPGLPNGYQGGQPLGWSSYATATDNR
jgi:predicted Zn-dependent protease